MSYTVTTDRARRGWLVVRDHDKKVMTNHLDVRVCLRWVKAWADVDLGR